MEKAIRARDLHKPHGKNKYCGPTVISVLSGLSTDDVAAVVRLDSRHRRSVKGMFDGEVVRAIRRLGGATAPVPGRVGKHTLAQWLDQRDEALRQVPLVVSAGHHYMLVVGDLVICSQTKDWVHIASHHFRNKRFCNAFQVPALPKPKLPPEVLALRKEQARNQKRAASARTRALALAAELRLELRRQDGDFIETWVADEAWWQAKLGPEGLLAEGESALDMIGERCRTTAFGWEDALDGLIDIRNEFDR